MHVPPGHSFQDMCDPGPADTKIAGKCGTVFELPEADAGGRSNRPPVSFIIATIDKYSACRNLLEMRKDHLYISVSRQAVWHILQENWRLLLVTPTRC
jgi:hypothetical protein